MIVSADEIAKVVYNSAIRATAWHPEAWPNWEKLGDCPARDMANATAKDVLGLLQRRLGDLKITIKEN
jgi:hypothetical protein